MKFDPSLDERLRAAVRDFWSTRELQSTNQGKASGARDTGARAAVTGGAQMNGFVSVISDLLEESGLDKPVIFTERSVELPGWYRPEKKWDLLVVVEGRLIAAIEFKSQVGSFGNNYNNRTEEALGSATDIWAAYREGAFSPSARPWLGYLMLLEKAPKSLAPVKSKEPRFKVFEEFRDISYAKRYEILLTKLVRERLYDSACFIMADRVTGVEGAYEEPSSELGFEPFIMSLMARAIVSKSSS